MFPKPLFYWCGKILWAARRSGVDTSHEPETADEIVGRPPRAELSRQNASGDGAGRLGSAHPPIVRLAAAETSPKDYDTMAKDTFRIVTRGADGRLHIRDYNKQETLQRLHTQVGVDDCSTDLALRGLPVFRGLIGPMPEGKNIIRYESPEVFETLTKEWSSTKAGRKKTAPLQAMGDGIPQV